MAFRVVSRSRPLRWGQIYRQNHRGGLLQNHRGGLRAISGDESTRPHNGNAPVAGWPVAAVSCAMFDVCGKKPRLRNGVLGHGVGAVFVAPPN